MAPPKKQKGRKSINKKVVPQRPAAKQKPVKKTKAKKDQQPVEEKPVEDIEQTTPVPDNEEPKPIRKRRGKVTLESYQQIIKEAQDMILAEIERKSKEREKGIRSMQRINKCLRILEKDAPKLANAKRRIRNPSGKRVSGFLIQYPITDEFAEFLQVDKGTQLNRREATNAICIYSHIKPNEDRPQMLQWKYLNPEGKRDLQIPGNKMAIMPDKALSKLLNYNKYVSQVKKGEIKKQVKDKETGNIREEVQDDPALYYWVIQRQIKSLFK
jgi:hypothetical protein